MIVPSLPVYFSFLIAAKIDLDLSCQRSHNPKAVTVEIPCWRGFPPTPLLLPATHEQKHQGAKVKLWEKLIIYYSTHWCGAIEYKPLLTVFGDHVRLGSHGDCRGEAREGGAMANFRFASNILLRLELLTVRNTFKDAVISPLEAKTGGNDHSASRPRLILDVS
jgi:hypothetical protein